LLRISSDRANDEVILRLEGEVTQPWTDELERMVTALFAEDKRVVLEMSAVRFIDAHAVDILHKWSNSVVLSNCTPFLRELLKVRTLWRAS
jgi:anti-anti-sigma factor